MLIDVQEITTEGETKPFEMQILSLHQMHQMLSNTRENEIFSWEQPQQSDNCFDLQKILTHTCFNRAGSLAEVSNTRFSHLSPVEYSSLMAEEYWSGVTAHTPKQ